MYVSLEQALLDLEKAGLLKRIHSEVDPNLEMAEMARIAFEKGGPALLFEKVKGSKFPANLFADVLLIGLRGGMIDIDLLC